MSGVGDAFFSFVTSWIVRRGESGGYEVKVRGMEGVETMFIQICRDYATLPPLNSITIGQIRFFYAGLRFELMGGPADG